MSDSDSDDELRPHQLARRHFGHRFISDSDDDEEVRDYESDDDSLASSLCSGIRDDIDDDSAASALALNHEHGINEASNLDGADDEFAREVAPQLPPQERADLGENTTSRKGRSIADHLIHNRDVYLLSLDLEHGGDYCGILQLSAEMLRVRIGERGKSTTKDYVEEWEAHPNTFNKYVNPGSNAIWDEAMIACHGLRRSDPRIVSADGILTVWSQFLSWFEEVAAEASAVIMVAWNGEKCDLKWLWKICQAPGSRCLLPDKLQYHIDPYHVIQSYTSCKIHPTKSKIDSLSLGVVFKFLFEEPIEGAHDSLIDCKSQTTIIINEAFAPFINRSQSVKLITQLFNISTINDWKKRMEPVRPVHEPWVELTDEVVRKLSVNSVGQCMIIV
jgi:hypothetical protein